ncbi:MAG: hypothetical protein F6K26_14480 [Moorea sp. SIO2I5]|nr:hypothetical protein [Moorena sp. SIO2I5]
MSTNRIKGKDDTRLSQLLDKFRQSFDFIGFAIDMGSVNESNLAQPDKRSLV